jgi:solute carrier family 50 protein (sugar transporter)
MSCVEPDPTFYPKFGKKCNDHGGEDETLFWIGNFASLACVYLFAAPLFGVMLPVIKQKTVGQFTDVPLLLTMINCTLQVLYQYPQGNMQPFLINVVGMGLNVTWLTIFMIYNENRKMLTAKIIGVVLVCVLCELVSVIMQATGSTEHQGIAMVGNIAVIFNIGMYGAPLAALGTVIATRSVKTLPITIVLAVLLASFLWGLYGKWIGDYVIGIPNDIGVCLAFVQIIIWLKFRNATPIEARDKLIEGGAKIADEIQA